MTKSNELLADLYDQDGKLPDDKLDEAVQRVAEAVARKGGVTYEIKMKAEEQHIGYVVRWLTNMVIQLNGDILNLQASMVAALGGEPEPVDFDPEVEAENMLRAFALDKLRRYYDIVSAQSKLVVP